MLVVLRFEAPGVPFAPVSEKADEEVVIRFAPEGDDTEALTGCATWIACVEEASTAGDEALIGCAPKGRS